LKLAALALASLGLAAPALAQQPAPEHHMIKPTAGLALLIPLAGEWTGQTPDGKTVRATYQVVSGGTAVIERLQMGAEPEMVSVYAPDGERVAITHFCSAGNQPQMQTGPVAGDAKQLSFDLVRVGNLATPATGHMHHLTLTLVDKDHLNQEWTWQEGGGGHAALFRFTRKT
jgi:hypothetical protein